MTVVDDDGKNKEFYVNDQDLIMKYFKALPLEGAIAMRGVVYAIVEDRIKNEKRKS